MNNMTIKKISNGYLVEYYVPQGDYNPVFTTSFFGTIAAATEFISATYEPVNTSMDFSGDLVFESPTSRAVPSGVTAVSLSGRAGSGVGGR